MALISVRNTDVVEEPSGCSAAIVGAALTSTGRTHRGVDAMFSGVFEGSDGAVARCALSSQPGQSVCSGSCCLFGERQRGSFLLGRVQSFSNRSTDSTALNARQRDHEVQLQFGLNFRFHP